MGDDLQAQLDAANAEIDRLKEENASLVKDVAVLEAKLGARQDVDRAVDEKNNAEERLRSAEEKLVAARDELAKLKGL